MVTFVGVIAVLVAITILLIVLAVVGTPGFIAEERRVFEAERAEARLQSPGVVRLTGEPMPEVAQPAETPAAAADLSPTQIHQNYCIACHGTGVMDAPRTGTEGDWTALLDERGLDGLVQNAITGIGNMPPRGGNPRLSDDEIRDTVIYMLEQSGISVD